MDWTEKYRPEHLRDLVGNPQSLRQMVTWAQTWTPRSRPLLLYGRPGTGKTSAAHALARDMGWDLVELNASDQRTRAVLEKVAGTSAITAPLFGAERKLILLDEVDNLHGTADRGGARAVLEIIGRAVQPLILIANSFQDVPAELRSRTETLPFRSPQARSIVPRLRFICSQEQVRCSDGALREISERSKGDVRAAVTMLYAAALGRNTLEEGDLQSAPKDERATIFDVVTAVFQGRSGGELLDRARYSGETPDTILQWMEGALRHLSDPPAVARAYRWIARADLYLGRTFRRQYYTLWKYVSAITLLGTAQEAGGQGIHARISPPHRWQHLGSSRRQRTVRAALLHTLSTSAHIPLHALREEYFTLFSLLVENDPEHYTRTLELEADQLNLFLHDRDRSAAIVKSVREKSSAPPPAAPAPRREPGESGKQSTLF